MHAPLRFLLALAICSALGGCGEDEPPAPTSEVPATPAAALAWVRAAEGREDAAELDRRLAMYPVDKTPFRTAPESQIVLTWRMQRALSDRRIADAFAAQQLLVSRFSGIGVSPRGRELASGVVRAGFQSAALRAAWEQIEGPAPDRSAALAALDLASIVQPTSDDEVVTRVERYVRLSQIDGVAADLSAHDGPRVVALVDDFALGETILPQVLGRWQRDLGSMGLRVSVVPLLTGHVRVGIRRLRAQDAQAELDSIRNRVIAYQIHVEAPASEGVRGAIGLEDGACALFVADRKGRIVARLSGPTIDPRPLETVVQRVASR